MKKILRQPLILIAIAAIAVALLWPRLSKNDEFPYVGPWEGDTTAVPGYIGRISFTEEGSCAYSLTIRGGEVPQTCDYEMRSREAFITTIQKRETYVLVFHVAIEPKDDGRMVSFQAIDFTHFDASGKQVEHRRFKELIYSWQKVR
jgi:hypothetical protein